MTIKAFLLIGAVSYSVSIATCPAQTTVSTDPVGVITKELPASGYTYFGVSLTVPPALTSSSTTLSGNQVGTGISLDNLVVGKEYAMEITSGSYEGFSADIASWTGQTITLEENIESGGVLPGTFNGSRISIRELPTLASIFGTDNSAGLKSGTLATADLIYIYASGSFSKYYYFPGGFGQAAEWRDEAGNEAGSTSIHFGDGLIIQTSDTAPKSIYISGSVKLGPTNVPIYPGFNLVSNPSPVDGRLTLANSGLQSGLKAGTVATADIIYIPGAGGDFEKYYYFPGGFGQSAEWREFSSGDNADATILPNKGSFFIDRQGGDTSVTITEDLPNN